LTKLFPKWFSSCQKWTRRTEITQKAQIFWPKKVGGLPYHYYMSLHAKYWTGAMCFDDVIV
jgi:Ulp1 family protease